MIKSARNTNLQSKWSLENMHAFLFLVFNNFMFTQVLKEMNKIDTAGMMIIVKVGLFIDNPP